MPNLNGTGPEGKGPLTGRKMGRCSDKKSLPKEQNENEEIFYGRGRGGRPRGGGGFGFGGRRRKHGRGFGRGYGRRFEDDRPNDSTKDNEE